MPIKIAIDKIRIEHSIDIYEIMQLVLKREKKLNLAKEHFWVIALNNANKIINIELIAIGSTKSVIVQPMEVLSVPLQKRAAGVILVHNHPSGIIAPSEGDKDVTDRLIQACKLMRTPVLDHVIITENSYYSFKESGLLDRLEASNNYVLPYDLERQYHEEMEEAIREVQEESKKQVQESLQKGLKKGKMEEKITIAQKLLALQLDPSVVQAATGISLAEIEKIRKNT